jgi:predicted O-linked N-acetylglucosamine transferase (SPINDLY family)
MELPAGDAHYSERLLRLPGLGIRYAPPVQAPQAPPLALPVGAPGYLYCPQTAAKLHPGHDVLYAAVAAACPHHPLVFTPHARAHVRDALEARLARSFRAAGLDPQQHLRVLPMLPFAQFLGLARGARLLLDSLDWSGGNTTLEALSLGVPVVTWPGTTMRSRHSAGLLAMGGLDAYCAADAGGYVQRVRGLVADDAQHHDTVARVRAAAPAWFDTEAPLQALVALLRDAVSGAWDNAHPPPLA